MASPNFGEISELQNEITSGQNYRLLLSQRKTIRGLPQRKITSLRRKQWRYRKSIKCKKKKKSKLTLVERHALTQKEYMRILAQPKKVFTDETVRKPKRIKRIKKKKDVLKYFTCPPHIKQLALPKKRFVLETWKQFQDLLPPEVLIRFNEILHYDIHRLEIEEASYYFKQLKRKKYKKRRRKHRKRQMLTEGLRRDIRYMAVLLCDFFKQQVASILDPKQLLMSDAILNFLVDKKVIKTKPERTTKNTCKKTIIEICNKLSLWFDDIAQTALLKPFDEDLVIITSELSSVEELEEEGEEEEEEEGEEEEVEEEEDELLDNLFVHEIEESESELEFDYDEEEGFDFFDEDILEKLIRILGSSSDDYLNAFLDQNIWPTATNRDVLTKLIEIRDGLLDLRGGRTTRLEDLMTNWARRNEPQEVDDRLLDKIQVTSRIIADLLNGHKPKTTRSSSSESTDEEERERRRREEEERRRREEEERRRREEEEAARRKTLEFYPEPEVTEGDELSMIRAHDPPVTYPHSPDKICCLSLKIWSIWLMQITQNLHKWTKWLICIIKQIRDYAAIVRDPQKQLYKSEWRQFCKDTDEKIVSWRQYSQHVQQLSDEIIANFSGKKVICCPACLYNHKIPNVVQAHETIRALVEAIDCAAYWHRCLDKIVEQASTVCDVDLEETVVAESSTTTSSTTGTIEIVETRVEPSEESVYEIEEIPVNK